MRETQTDHFGTITPCYRRRSLICQRFLTYSRSATQMHIAIKRIKLKISRNLQKRGCIISNVTFPGLRRLSPSLAIRCNWQLHDDYLCSYYFTVLTTLLHNPVNIVTVDKRIVNWRTQNAVNVTLTQLVQMN